MVRSIRLAPFSICILALAAAFPASGGAAIRTLSDSTRIETWTLPNGLQVVTRDVPAGGGVAITLAFGVGSNQDPQGREGWNQLLAQVAFLSAAGEFPSRTEASLNSSRKLGWNVEVGPSYTRFTEVAEPRQFPGVLHEMAARLRAPQPDAAVLTDARRAVTNSLASDYHGQVSVALYYEVATLGEPAGDRRIDRFASGLGIAKATLAEIVPALGTTYAPAGAVLSLAGNLSGSAIDVKRVVASEFGSIPGGTPPRVDAAPAPRPGFRRRIREDIDAPIGVIGLIAPALSDTSHPSFFMNSLVIGTLLNGRWGRDALLPTPFRYVPLDDPSLARIYAPITKSDLDSSMIREGYEESLLACKQATFSVEEFTGLRDGVAWLLGGPMTQALRARSSTDPGVLATLSTTAAMRSLHGGEAFWADYARRFMAIGRPEFGRWYDYFVAPEHKAQLVYTPSYAIKP